MIELADTLEKTLVASFSATKPPFVLKKNLTMSVVLWRLRINNKLELSFVTIFDWLNETENDVEAFLLQNHLDEQTLAKRTYTLDQGCVITKKDTWITYLLGELLSEVLRRHIAYGLEKQADDLHSLIYEKVTSSSRLNVSPLVPAIEKEAFIPKVRFPTARSLSYTNLFNSLDSVLDEYLIRKETLYYSSAAKLLEATTQVLKYDELFPTTLLKLLLFSVMETDTRVSAKVEGNIVYENIRKLIQKYEPLVDIDFLGAEEIRVVLPKETTIRFKNFRTITPLEISVLSTRRDFIYGKSPRERFYSREPSTDTLLTLRSASHENLFELHIPPVSLSIPELKKLPSEQHSIKTRIIHLSGYSTANTGGYMANWFLNSIPKVGRLGTYARGYIDLKNKKPYLVNGEFGLPLLSLKLEPIL